MEQVEASIERYLSALEAADRQDGEVAEAKSARLKDKIASLGEQMRRYKALEAAERAAPDKQISLTDPGARSMATSGKYTGLVSTVNVASGTACNVLHSTSAKNTEPCRSGPSALKKAAKAARRARGVSSLANLIFVGKTNIAS